MPNSNGVVLSFLTEYWPWAAALFGAGVANNKLMRKSQFYEEQKECQTKLCNKIDELSKVITGSNLKVARELGAVEQFMKEHMKD